MLNVAELMSLEGNTTRCKGESADVFSAPVDSISRERVCSKDEGVPCPSFAHLSFQLSGVIG